MFHLIKLQPKWDAQPYNCKWALAEKRLHKVHLVNKAVLCEYLYNWALLGNDVHVFQVQAVVWTAYG